MCVWCVCVCEGVNTCIHVRERRGMGVYVSVRGREGGGVVKV